MNDDPEAEPSAPSGLDVSIESKPNASKRKMDAAILSGPFFPVIWKLSVPLVIGAILDNALMLVDMYFVGKLGTQAVAAVGIGGVWMGIIFMLIYGVSIACGSLVSIAVGHRDPERAGQVAGQSLMIACAFSVIVALSVIPLTPWLFSFLAADNGIAAEGIGYVNIMAGCVFTAYIPFVLFGILRGAGDTVSPMIVMAISNVINVILDPLLIFGYGPIPAMGVSGSAWATVIARFLGVGYLLIRMGGIRIPGVQLTKRSFFPNAEMIWRLTTIGFFASSQMLMRNIAAIAMMKFVKPFGADAQAAYTIVIRLWFITLGIGINYGIAASIMVGQNIGANQMARAEKSAWLTAAYFSIATLAASVFAFIFDEALVAIFQTDTEVVRIGSLMIQWLLWTLPFMGFSVVLTRALNGAGDTRSALIMTALPILIIQVPLAYYLSNHWPIGTPQNINGIFAAFAVSVVIQAMMMTYAFKSGRWKTIGARHRDIGKTQSPTQHSVTRTEKIETGPAIKPSGSQCAAGTDRTRLEERQVPD